MQRDLAIGVVLLVGTLGSGCAEMHGTLLRPLKGNGTAVSAFSSTPSRGQSDVFGPEPVPQPAPKPAKAKVATAPTPDENPYAEAMTASPAPAPKAKKVVAAPADDMDALFDFSAPKSASRSGSRRMQDDPQFARLNQEMLELEQAEKDYRKASRMELKRACVKHQAKACELLEKRSRNADARHALEKKYRANAG
jgi:hypothetical protein